MEGSDSTSRQGLGDAAGVDKPRAAGGGGAVELRQATAGDGEFLYALRRDALGPYVVETFGPWDDRQQRERSFAAGDVEAHQVVLCEGVPVGCLKVRWLADEVCLDRVFILPAHQRRGLGTRLIRQVQGEARAKRLPVRLRVLRVNPARRLYERLGFVVTGQTETHTLMEYVDAARP